MVKNIYIAGPLFNIHERRYLEEIALIIEQHGYQCFLPHRDQKGITEAELRTVNVKISTRRKIFRNDLIALRKSDLTVALITGWDIDSGTAGEIGFTYACGKPVIAIDACERRYRNLFIEGMIAKVVHKPDEVPKAIEKVSR